MALPLTSDTGNRHADARAEWDNRWTDLARGKRNWQIAALLLLIVDVALTALLGYSSTQSRITPYVVEVDRHGQAVAFGPAERLRAVDERLMRYLLNHYIYNLRSVIADQDVQKTLLLRAYAYTTDEAANFLNAHFQTSNPIRVSLDRTVRVQVTSVLSLGSDTWQIQWTETAYPRGGAGRVEETAWQAIAKVRVVPPQRTNVILLNPIGLYVTDLTWTQLAKPEQENP